MDIVCCSLAEDSNSFSGQHHILNANIGNIKINDIINAELDNDLLEPCNEEEDIIVKNIDSEKIQHNEFCSIFGEQNFINFKNEILELCKQEKIPIKNKTVDDDLLQILSIFTSSEFKETLETEEQLNVLEKVTNLIINNLLDISNNHSLIAQTKTLFSNLQTWILNKPSIQLQNDIIYLSKMINFILDNKLNENFTEEFDLCYSAVLKSFDNYSIQDNKVISTNYEYFIEFLMKNGTLAKIGKACESVCSQAGVDYNIAIVISDLMPLLCKNIIFAHENFYKVLFKHRNLLVDSNKILPVGMAFLSSFIYEKQYNTNTFQFLNNLFINTIQKEIKKYSKEPKVDDFISFLQILEQYFEY